MRDDHYRQIDIESLKREYERLEEFSNEKLIMQALLLILAPNLTPREKQIFHALRSILEERLK